MTADKILSVVCLTVLVGVAHAAAPPSTLTRKSLQPVVRKYLKEKGDFCLGKLEWPIAVSAVDRERGTSDSLQMPVLEKLGLVSAAEVPSDPAVTQYSLTERGRKYYLAKKTVTVNAAGQRIQHPGDLCPAHLQLDEVVGWAPPSVTAGQTQTTIRIRYTYKVARAADWASDPDIRKVFPMMARILDNAGTQHLEQLFVWTDKGWTAVTPGG
jgi:hypothetical protein